MNFIPLSAKKREIVGKKLSLVNLKKEGIIPAVLYGRDFTNLNLQINLVDFEKAFKEAGYSSILNLDLGEKEPLKVMIYDVTYDPLKEIPTHVDFYKVNMKEEINAEVDITFVGKSKAVTELSAILVKNITKLDIRCLPDKLIKEVVVDISALSKIDDSVKIKDLNIPAGIKIEGHHADDIVILATEKAKEEVVVSQPTTVEPEVMKKGKVVEEGEEAEAGAEKKGETKKTDSKK